MTINRADPIKVFVINLRRSVDRRIHMATQLNRLKIPFEFVDAVDGQALSDPEIRRRYGLSTFPPWRCFNARHLSSGEIGCALSHLGIYRRMMEYDIACACILEDDTELGNDVGVLLTGHFLLEVDWELLLIGHGGSHGSGRRGAECSSKRQHVFGCYEIGKPVEAPVGTYAYLVKRSGAEKLLGHAYPLRMPMDRLIGHGVAGGVGIRVLVPPCTTHNGAVFGSTVGGDNEMGQLYLSRARRMQWRVGQRCPNFRKLRESWLGLCARAVVQMRKLGVCEDGYADKRLFARPR